MIASCDGDYVASKGLLEWRISIVDAQNSSGALEFNVRSRDANDFFPVVVNFASPKTYAGVVVAGVVAVDGGASVPFGIESKFVAEKYEIV